MKQTVDLLATGFIPMVLGILHYLYLRFVRLDVADPVIAVNNAERNSNAFE